MNWISDYKFKNEVRTRERKLITAKPSGVEASEPAVPEPEVPAAAAHPHPVYSWRRA